MFAVRAEIEVGFRCDTSVFNKLYGQGKDGWLTMAEFINSLTGTRMWVAPGREGEYRLAGHKPVEKDAAGGPRAFQRKRPGGPKKCAPVKK